MSYKFFRLFFVLILVIGLVAIPAPQPARAAGPWYVSPTGNDTNDCLSPTTSCGTINGALAKPGFVPGDTVRVAIGTYTGAGTEVVLIDKDVTLSGGWNAGFTTQSGTSTVDGQSARRGIKINIGVIVTIDRFTIQNGSFVGFGGGIYNAGTSLTMNNSNIINNTATGDGGGNSYGGGIHASGTTTLTNSILNGNTATVGGGIYNSNYTANGAAYNPGVLTLNNSVITNNIASNGGGGGGIYNGGYGGNMVINSSSLSNNTAGAGAGILNEGFDAIMTINNSAVINNIANGLGGGGIFNNSGAITLNNTTISGNSAYGGGGGIVGGNLTLNNSTVTNNTATNGPGGGISGNIILQNSIIALNSVFGFAGPDCSGNVTSNGYNLIGNNSDCTFASTTGDLVGTSSNPINPRLTPLQDNGGSTLTHALLPGSPAIDAGNPAGCTDQNGNPLTTDQRGVTRPQGTACDIGAFELEAETEGILVSIDIKPGNPLNTINLRELFLPVAILSTAQFNAPQQVDRNSLTFGATGNENSLTRTGHKHLPNCQVNDVNKDGYSDLVCKFELNKTGFQPGDTKGILKGLTINNLNIEGSDSVIIKLDH